MNVFFCCRICFNHRNREMVQAVKVAPQWTGGNEDEPATWIPVCAYHFEHWFDRCDENEKLPAFDIAQHAMSYEHEEDCC